MTFVPGKIQIFLLDATYRARMDADFRSKGKGGKVECNKCGKELAVRSLAGHLAKQHNVDQLFVLKEEQDGLPPPPPRRWDATYYPAEGCYHCPVPGCPQGRDGSGMGDSWNVRWHFTPTVAIASR